MDMTAIVVIHTNQGFVVAADGRAVWDKDRQTNDEQKVFRRQYGDRSIVFAAAGWVLSEDRTQFNLIRDIDNAMSLLSGIECDSFESYIGKLKNELNKAIERAIHESRIEPSPGEGCMAIVFVACYFRDDEPSVATIELYATKQFALARISPLEPEYFYGPKEIREMAMSDTDQRFSMRRPHQSCDSIEKAEALARAYIEACCDFSPKDIGGHIHIAKLTPNGSEWIAPPKQDEQ
ncbi:MAG TPA: hypothetical protein VKV15_02080 [Bryobacteraceae bacterium]|nr:hypothetical protein [Bryobacteraceae bacterium]